MDDAGRLRTGNETILLVDDEEVILEVGEMMLEELGYSVLTANGGRAAIDIFREHRNTIQLVVLDMIMPGLNGGATFDEIRKIDPQARVLLSSGYSVNGQAQKILDAGCSGFIQKPFGFDEFSDTIRSILDD
jgi:DNA-binding NtrC family response regulator